MDNEYIKLQAMIADSKTIENINWLKVAVDYKKVPYDMLNAQYRVKIFEMILDHINEIIKGAKK